MPEIDRLGRVTERVKDRLTAIRKRVREQASIGPGRIRLNPQEALARLQAMTAEERQTLMQRMGPDKFMENVEALLDKAASGER